MGLSSCLFKYGIGFISLTGTMWISRERRNGKVFLEKKACFCFGVDLCIVCRSPAKIVYDPDDQ